MTHDMRFRVEEKWNRRTIDMLSRCPPGCLGGTSLPSVWLHPGHQHHRAVIPCPKAQPLQSETPKVLGLAAACPSGE